MVLKTKKIALWLDQWSINIILVGVHPRTKAYEFYIQRAYIKNVIRVIDPKVAFSQSFVGCMFYDMLHYILWNIKILSQCFGNTNHLVFPTTTKIPYQVKVSQNCFVKTQLNHGLYMYVPCENTFGRVACITSNHDPKILST